MSVPESYAQPDAPRIGPFQVNGPPVPVRAQRTSKAPFQISIPSNGEMVPYSREFAEAIEDMVTPNRFNVIVRLYRTVEKVGSIILSHKSEEDVNISESRAQILALGPDCFKGKEHPSGNALDIEVGDWILMNSYAGGQVKLADFPDEEIRIIADTTILARIADPDKVDRKW